MYNKIVLAAVAVVLVAGGALLLSNRINKPSEVQDTVTSSQPTPTSPASLQEATITLTQSGFSPASVTIKSGTRVIWVNKSGASASVNSATHPTHRVYPALNLGRIDEGSSLQLVFSKKGTYRYHNHLNPDQSGTITVE